MCKLFSLLLPLLLALVVGPGCAETRAVKATPKPLEIAAAEPKHDAHVALVLEPELKVHAVKMQLIGGEAIHPIGEQLAAHATDVTRNVFRDVQVYDSVAAASGKADLVVLVKATKSSLFAPNPIKVLIAEEWTIKDRSGQQTLWLTTIEAEANDKPALAAVGKRVNRAFQTAFDQLSAKAYATLRDSTELKLQVGKLH